MAGQQRTGVAADDKMTNDGQCLHAFDRCVVLPLCLVTWITRGKFADSLRESKNLRKISRRGIWLCGNLKKYLWQSLTLLFCLLFDLYDRRLDACSHACHKAV